jgi:hypothetical protein
MVSWCSHINTLVDRVHDILVNDGRNRLIHDTFAQMYGDGKTHNNPLIDLENKPLSKGFKTSQFSFSFCSS